MDLDDAVQTHAQWKMRFRSAISKQEQLDAQMIGKDNCCLVGKWLHGEGKQRWGAAPEFQKALEQHRLFHVEAGKVAQLINNRRYDQAEQAIGPGTSYSSASSAVGVALIGLKRLAG